MHEITEEVREAINYIQGVVLFGDIEEIPLSMSDMINLATVVDHTGSIIDEEAYWRCQVAAYLQAVLNRGELFSP